MEAEEIQAQACNNNSTTKFPRNKLGQKGGHDHHYPGDEGDLGDQVKRPNTGSTAIDGGNRLRGWHHSSRIIRVSRASGGKDRHSKVWTSKGLRDRRVRLSVTTAIQFYDLQDRLGCDQPSKAVEWLINAASDSIAELPSLNSSFPDTPKQLSDEKRPSVGKEQGFDSAEVVELELDQGEANYQHQNQQHLSLSKSACSSTSETSKGSGLSLSRSEIRVNRVKARERARERAAKDKERENSDSRIPPPPLHNHHHHHQNINSISQSPSFTELLTGGISNVNTNSNNNNDSSSPTTASDQPNLFHKGSTAMATATATATAMHMDYFTTGLLGLSSTRNHHHHHSSGFAGLPMAMSMPQPFSVVSSGGDGHTAAEALPPQFSFVPEQLIATTSSQPNGSGGDYSLNFSISSSGLAGFNRGTLQSNSSPSSFLPHLQRFASPIDGTTNVPFFIGASPMENHHHHHNHHNHHQFPAGFDGRLQLYYGDGGRHSDQKGKGKN